MEPIVNATLTWLQDAGVLALGSKLVTAAVIVAVALLLRWLAGIVIHRLVNRIVSGVKRKHEVTDTQALTASPIAAMRIVQRTRTLGSVLRNILNVIIISVVVLMLIDLFAPGVLGSLALLTAAVGAGLGFGAQNIVKDVLNGIFMVVEDQYGVGDIVDLGGASGVVEAVSIRVTQVRDVNGTLWFVRNGEISQVGNMSQGWARVIIDLAIPYDSDIDAIEAAVLETATELATASAWRSRILEKPEIWGIESISAEAVVTRVVIKTRTSAKDDVARELRMRIKSTLDAMGVKLPALNSITLSKFESASRVRGANKPKTKPIPTVQDTSPAKPKSRARKPSSES
ncbi:MAG TPA: mechanosensitive ion channel domain-containing protein [Microbacteriaceae bacterium]|nr:mechanosensitive ion channel domain-containing protein [Microbacteriaceae bacterium]